MPVFLLSDAHEFPPPELANEDGVLAVGGDFHPRRLISAYRTGIFPWPVDDLPLLWFSPDPRYHLPLDRVHVSRRLRRTVRQAPYEVRFDTAFADVIELCKRTPRPGQDGTWITGDLLEGYTRLHRDGFAHSAEAYRDGELVGGLYGVSLGGAFFGESMFATAPDASKVAFLCLLGHFRMWGFSLVDCQVETPHLQRFGGENIPRTEFLSRLELALRRPTKPGPWSEELSPAEALEQLEESD
ncbi:MAG: leucyl/phenylalanyl-tRNA--protein transferase [Myxococcota bacterium]